MEKGNNEAHILTEPLTSATCAKCGKVVDVTGLPAFSQIACPGCGAEMQVPTRFGAFILLQLLGAGGMGGVYRARDEALNREVAIKVMLKSLGDDPHFVETFQREAQAAAKLNHPNIAQIYSFGQEHGQPYIVMELVSGGSMDKLIATQGSLGPAAAIQIGVQIADGLREAADAGLVHGDVKPENILFDTDKNAKLVDFGLAAMNSGSANEVWGTPFYIAPEKVRRQKTDFRADIYSLGATLYHAIAGVPPFDGADATAVVKARFDGPPKPLRELRPNIPEDVENLIARMVEVEPQKRYPTYGSLIGDMRRYLSKAGPVRIAPSNKKIVIKGRTPKTVTTLSSSGARATTGSLGADGAFSGAASEEEAPAKNAAKIIGLLFGGVILLILLIVGGIFGTKAYLGAKKTQAEAVRVEQNQTKANASIANSLSKAKMAVERVRAYVTEALDYAKAATDAAVVVLGEESRARLVPPEPAYAVPKPSVGEGTNQPSAAVSNAVAAVSNGVPAAAVAEAEPAPAAEPAPDASAEPQDPLVPVVRGMYMEAYGVKKVSVMADAQLAAIEEMARVAETLTQPEQSDELVKQANALVEKVNALSNMREVSDIPRIIVRLKKGSEKVKADALSLAEVKKQEAIEKARQAKEAELAEKKRQAQEALKEKGKAECERVAATEIEAGALAKQLQFREASRLLKDLTDGLETKDGLDALNWATERISRIKDFHTYLVEKVPGFKSARGWGIEQADPKYMQVAGKRIAWTEVYASRQEIIGTLINELVVDERATKTLSLRERSRLMTNAALCLFTFYKDMPFAQEKAKQLATTAAQQFSPDADTVKALMPSFFTE